MDFMPVKIEEEYLDTGGDNYFSYYRHMDRASLNFPSVETEQFRDGDDYHSDFLAYIDPRRWVHTINGSCWKKAADGKMGYIHSYFEQLLGKSL